MLVSLSFYPAAPSLPASALTPASCCRYKGMDGMERWVGLCIIAHNLNHIGKALALQAGRSDLSGLPQGSEDPGS
jgi:hypothetical protein